MEKQKNTNGLKKWIVIALFTIAAILSGIFMGKVAINYNLADYLGKDTQTKIALDIIDSEFGMTANIQVMAKNVTISTAEEMKDKIETVDNVISVNFDKYDETYYKDKTALFMVIIDGDEYSENAKQALFDIKETLSSYEGMQYGGTVVEKKDLQDAITSETTYILVAALCLIVAILLITSESWIEPIILLIASGIAILINRGTNIIFSEISYITNSIAALLQLALSIDYSIVLLNTYRKEKANNVDINSAMHIAIKETIKPVSASALTTIAGLLALLFMSFRIGFDIGIVLMKGIVISAISSLTLFPALILLCDKAMKRTKKKAFVPQGKTFSNIAYKANKIIVLFAFVLIVACGILQTGNSYRFTDTKTGNKEITDVFGNNNSVIVVYKNSNNNYENEKLFAEAVSKYKTEEGKIVLTNYTAYTNTVRELYDLDKIIKKLDVSEKDAKTLLTMYNLYNSMDSVKMTFSEFVDYSNELVETDDDVKDLVDDDIVSTLKTIKTLSYVLQNEMTAEELYEKLSSVNIEGSEISLFSIEQIYGLYYYDSIINKNVDFKTMINYIINSSSNQNISSMFDENTITQLIVLQAGIEQFQTNMETEMSKETFKEWFYSNIGTLLTDEQLEQIFNGYFYTTQETPSDTIKFLPLMKFLVQSNQITDEETIKTINGYDMLYQTINSKYGYETFIQALSTVATGLSGAATQIPVTNETLQQLYIMYFYSINEMPNKKLNGKTFATFVLEQDKINMVINSQLNDNNRNSIVDLLTLSKYVECDEEMNFEIMFDSVSNLQKEIKSKVLTSSIDKDKISGVFIKYAINNDSPLLISVMACNLLDFIIENMDTNSLLKEYLDDENLKKINDAQSDIKKATDLFYKENYSRMLLSVNLPNEGNDTTEFVKYLSQEARDVFGEEAYITGEIVSTYDLQESFDHDNMFITIFTLISIFIIIMIVFKSLSLPVVLVVIIQGAIFIAMSTQLLGNDIFFMSYIVSTCILMGATIDYGILMSSNYVSLRNTYDKKEALERSVQAAMPTVFTSGLILTISGFVLHFTSSQNSISTVGLLISIGTICSVVMIIFVLPSTLYLFDKFILKLSIRKKN